MAYPQFLLAPVGQCRHKSAMQKLIRRAVFGCALAVVGAVTCLAAENPFLGYWELTVPSGGAGWLGVEEKGGGLQASILWEAGSVVPVNSAKVEGDKLVLTREHSFTKKDAAGKEVKKTLIETITATTDGNKLSLVTTKQRENGGEDKAQFTGKRTPPMPKAPDLAKLRFAAPIQLFNGKDLSGWRLVDSRAVNGWSAKDGMLVCSAIQEEGKPHKNYGNLRTDREFEDFNLKLEFRVPEKGNSGIYLRGIYEVQVADSFGQSPDSHRVGGLYSRITPTANAAKRAGEWQTMDITLADRHVTVILNGQKVIDNKPVLGCTGGALWSDVSRPGPIYLQGDHTSMEYRNIVLTPRIKD